MSDAFSSVGTVLKIGSPLVAVAEVTSINGANLTRGTIEVTNLDSIGGYREFISSFRDGGEMAVELNFTRAGYDVFKDEFDTDIVTPYEMIFNDTDNTTFDGNMWVIAIGKTAVLDDKVTMSATLKVTGQETLTT